MIIISSTFSWHIPFIGMVSLVSNYGTQGHRFNPQITTLAVGGHLSYTCLVILCLSLKV